MDFLTQYYEGYDEDGRLLSQHGRVEYLTTQKYIHECLSKVQGRTVLEVGAGTGRYSIALAREGYSVTAVELVRHNIDILTSKLDGSEDLRVLQGNALDLSVFPDDAFDVTLLLGPMYHLYTKEDMLGALSESLRVTKRGGYLLVAYCMNEAAMIMTAFYNGRLTELLERGIISEDWHCISEPRDLFQMVRTEEIAALDAAVPADRIKLVATDGATNYLRALIDIMNEATFGKWLEYHFATCERPDLVGASNHTLDILRKK